jgi:hypothetical protein
MGDVKPVTVHVSIFGPALELQQEHLDEWVRMLSTSIVPGSLAPPTARIVVEWGDEEGLTKLREADIPALVTALEEAQRREKAIWEATAKHHPGCADGGFCTLPQEIARILKGE